MKSNNLPSEEVTFLPDQLIFVPIPCGCTGNQSFYNVTYEIKAGDSFYFVSISAFENLTDFHAVEASNPTLVPTMLKVGQEVVFPLYCKCPDKNQRDQGINFLVTYVWQLGDDISALSKKMNTSTEAILIANNYRNLSAAVAFPILVPIPMLPKLPPPLYYNATLPCEKQNPKSITALIITSSLLGSILALVLLYFLIIAYYKHFSGKSLVRLTSRLETSHFLQSNCTSFAGQNTSPRVVDKLLTGVTEYLDKPIMFETKNILEATMNLDQRFRLGTSVYQATINGEVFAVRQVKGVVTEEVNILRKVNHANLVKLAGVSNEIDGSCFLVYEFAGNGSLDKWLYPKTSSLSSAYFLSWRQRLMIALDVANGLQYMHDHTSPSIVHGDIRTRNILLNVNFKAKISNFSSASPASNALSPVTDVFGFGVVLLELLSGKRAIKTKEDGQISMLWKDIRAVLEVEEEARDRLKQWMDLSLGDIYPMDGALSLVLMARACTSDVSSERPRMSDIVFNLSVLVHSCSNEFERGHSSHSGEAIRIISPVVAR